MSSIYSMYSKYYDSLNDNYDFWFPFLDEQIIHFPPGSKIIEYGCGTGNILGHYADKHRVTGVDISPGMLDRAKQKIPKGQFHLGDMVTFQPEEKFDIALCLFDTVNHILDFQSWSLFFDNVEKALAPNGIFILDANTTERLTQNEKRPAYFQEFDNNYFYMKLRRKNEKNFIFDVRILRKVQENNFEEEREEIEETTETGNRILQALEKSFPYVVPYNDRKEVIQKKQHANNESHRWFFVCKKIFAG